MLVSLAGGLGILLLQVWHFVETGIWYNYTLIDTVSALDWPIPIHISEQELIDDTWNLFLAEGSLVLTLLFYVPLVILMIGLAMWYCALRFGNTMECE
jgi:hypothetical protein